MKVILNQIGKSLYMQIVQNKAKKSQSKHDQLVYLLSFPSVHDELIIELLETFSVVICYTKPCEEQALKYQELGATIYGIDSFFSLINKVVPLVKGAKVVLCDNYFAFLGGIDFKEETKVVQLWHANGAVKNFGLEASYAKKASPQDKMRYQKVYDSFTHFIVGSNKMATIFKTSYQVKNSDFLALGYSPTDKFFDEKKRKAAKETFDSFFPKDDYKKIYLYAPTYREGDTLINLMELQTAIPEDVLLLVKVHPHDQLLTRGGAKEQTANLSTDLKGISLFELLIGVDGLITDYSSIPFEYTLTRPSGELYFFCYDYDQYQEKVGIQADFKNWVPSPILKNIVELKLALANPKNQDFEAFNQLWNEYNNGEAKLNLIQWIGENYEN